MQTGLNILSTQQESTLFAYINNLPKKWSSPSLKQGNKKCVRSNWLQLMFHYLNTSKKNISEQFYFKMLLVKHISFI